MSFTIHRRATIGRLLHGLAVLAVLLTAATPVSAEVAFPCDPEPGDMLIEYGDFLDGGDCAISPAGDTDLFRFFGAAGERVLISATDQTGLNTPDVCIELLGPDGLPTSAGSIICREAATHITETLAADGLYTIVVRESGDNATFAFGLLLERINPPSPEALPLCFGCTEASSIIGPGDIDVHIFEGSAGDVVRIGATDLTGLNTPDVCIELLGPDGLPTPNGGTVCGEAATSIEETLSADGPHLVIVREAGDNATLNYTVSLQCVLGTCLPLPCELVLGVGHAEGALSMDFVLAIAEPATWNVWMSVGSSTFEFWSVPLPPLDPVSVPISFPLRSIGTVGILTTLTTQDGIICSDWRTVDTGMAP